MYVGAMILTIVSNIGYHLSQRSINSRTNPLVSLILTYLTAIIATLIVLPFFRPEGTLAEQIKSANWATYALGLAAVGLEFGFLLVYRAGWKISFAALFSNVMVTLLLIPLGLMVFKEHLEPKKMIGMTLAIAGLYLIGSA